MSSLQLDYLGRVQFKVSFCDQIVINYSKSDKTSEILAFISQAKFADRWLPLVGEVTANVCG
jgi:hypothetical protein